MATDIAQRDGVAVLEKVVIQGDLSSLSPGERMEYYGKVCESMGLNPLTKPFDYIKLNGKLTLYAKKDATEQLAKIHGVSITLSEGRNIEGVYLVQARASTSERSVDATGAVSIENLKGETRANALMKAETKACRRAVLRFVGLGWLDETEVETVPSAATVTVDRETGEIKDSAGSHPRQGGPTAPQGREKTDSELAHTPQQPTPWERFTDFVHEQGRSLSDVEAVVGDPPTQASINAWAKQQGLGSMSAVCERLTQEWADETDAKTTEEVFA